MGKNPVKKAYVFPETTYNIMTLAQETTSIKILRQIILALIEAPEERICLRIIRY